MTTKHSIAPRQDAAGHDAAMYFSAEVSSKMAALEQNDKHYRVSAIIDRAAMQLLGESTEPLYVAELGGGAHPDRYHTLFRRLLLEPQSRIDWVDISPHMLELAKHYIANDEYRQRSQVISFIASDMLDYLRGLDDNVLDLALLKYTFDYVDDLEDFFVLLKRKLKSGGKVVATMSTASSELKSYSTNARYLFNGEEFPDNETRILHDGDTFTVRFFKVSGDPSSGYLEGAETVKHYHSADKIKAAAMQSDFECYLGDWKGFVNATGQGGEMMDQEILVLIKK